MKHARQDIKIAAQKTGNFTKSGTKKLTSIKDVLDVSDETTEAIYGQGYLLYNTGRYNDASQIFKLLLTMNTTEAKYTMGLAACFHMLKEYQSAASTYMLVSSIDPLTPIPYFHASDCYIQIGDKASAALMLEMALKRSGDKKEFATLKQRAEITLAGLKKELSQGK